MARRPVIAFIKQEAARSGRLSYTVDAIASKGASPLVLRNSKSRASSALRYSQKREREAF